MHQDVTVAHAYGPMQPHKSFLIGANEQQARHAMHVHMVSL